jgi:two-component system sensor histidine kinase RegB
MSAVTMPPTDQDNRLHRLLTLRWVAVAAELSLVLATRRWLGSGPPLEPVLAICAAQLGLNLASMARWPRAAPLGEGRLLAQLLLDVAALTGIAYLSGGATNPLISLYLLWIAAAAAMLEAHAAWILAMVCIGAYSMVNFMHAELHIHDPEQALEAHLVGMWAVFVFSAVTICWSVIRLTAAVRRRDAELAGAREAALRNERVVALGNLAAGAAHELGTPLATMTVLAGEMLHDPALPAALRPDLELLRSQLGECKRIITQLAAQAGTSRAEAVSRTTIDAWLEQLLQRWRVQRPVVEPRVSLAGARPGPAVTMDATLGQALLNLFNNAADASPGQVDIEAQWSQDRLDLRVQDRGRGIPAAVLPSLGREPVPARGEGLGMGLMLACTAIERSGGELEFGAREGGGTVAHVRLPLAA